MNNPVPDLATGRDDVKNLTRWIRWKFFKIVGSGDKLDQMKKLNS